MMKPNKIILFVFSLVLVAFGIAVIFRGRILAPMVKRVLIQVVAAELDLGVTVEQVSGTYLRDLRLTGVRTVKPSESGMLVSIGAATIHARYSLPQLLQGTDAFLGGLRLELDEASVKMDFTRTGEEADDETEPPSLILVLPLTRARNSAVDLRGRDWALSLSGMDLTVAAFDEESGGIPLTVQATGSVLELPFLRRQTPELGARGVLTRYSVRIDGLEVNDRPAVSAARFDYEPDQPVLGSATFTAFDGSGTIRAVFAEASTELEWDLRQVNVAAVAALLDLEEPPPAGQLTSSGRLAGNFAEPVSLNGDVSLLVTDGSFRNQSFSRLSLVGAAAAGVLRLDSLEAAMGKNTVSASKLSVPLDALLAGEVERSIRNSRGLFSAHLEDIPALLELAGIAVPSGYLPEGLPPHRLVLAGRVAEEGVALDSGTFSEGSGTVTLEHFTATWPDTGPLLTGLSLSARLSAKISDLSRTAALFGLDTVGGNLQAEAALDGPLKNLQGNVELHGKDLRYREAEVDSLSLVARADSDGWRILNLEALKGEDRLAGSGGFATEPLLFKGLVLDLTVRDFHPYLAWFRPGETPAIHGGLTAHLELSGSPAAPVGSFRTVLTDADFTEFSVSRGELAGTMAGETIEITTLQMLTSEGRLELAGTFQHRAWGVPVSGTIDRLTLAREEISLQLLAPVAVRMDGGSSWSFEEATLQGEAGTFHLAGGVSTQTGLALSLRLSEVKSSPLKTLFRDLPIEFSGLNLAVTITGTLTAPEVAVKGSVAELRSPDAFAPLAGQFDFLLSSRGLVLKTFSWTTEAGEQFVLTGTIPYDPYSRRFLPAALEVDGNFSIPDLSVFSAFVPEAFRVPGLLQGSLRISGTGEQPEATIDFHAREVSFPASFPVRPPGPVAVDAIAVLKDNDLHLESFAVTGDDFSLSLAGIWRQAGNLLKQRAAEDGLPGSLDLRGSFAVADISWLARGVPMIRRLGGEVEGSLALSGPAAKPDFVAELSLADGEFRAEATMPSLRDLQVQVGIAQRTATIKQFSGSIGGSPFKLEGSVRLSEDGEPEADLRVQGANLLLYRSEAFGVRGDADLTIRGSFAAPAFAGTFAITDGRLRKNINWLEPLRGIGQTRAPVAGTAGPGGLGISFHNPPLRDATFDIRVTSKNPFQVKSNVARGNLRPDLWLRGNGEIPLLTGVIYIDRSRILLPAGRLAVEAGLIRFPENSPNRPLLEISGASRILGYDINLTVEGPYDEPTVSLSSVPPLPQDALLLLLLTGRLPPGEVEQNRGWQEGMRVALYVGKGVLEEWFGGNDLDSEESLLERFDIVTGRGISRQGNETIGAQYRLADDVLRDGDELYLVAERDIYDEFNAGIRIVFRFK